MPDSELVRTFVDAARERHDASARRLIVTVLGDSIVPRGGAIWLSGLIRLLDALGVQERLVRTSVQRLVAEGILDNERIGRRSRYAVTAEAGADARAADRRIYHRSTTEWSGRWTVLVAVDRIDDELVRRLGWRGLGQIRPGVVASPTVTPDVATELLDELDARGSLVVLDADVDDDRRLGAAAFDLSAVGDAYDQIAQWYEPLMEHLDGLDDRVAFALRTVLVDDFRRVVLRDPALPDALLPETWPGHLAREVAAGVYRAVAAGADRFVAATGAEDGDPLPGPAPWAQDRFVDT
ncbi:MAG: PaaX family transcriptional regulator C-terminal domain-containing protein [Actinomycetota bacterium]